MSEEKTNDGGQAYPTDGYYLGECSKEPSWHGMSLREWYAGMALHGVMSDMEGVFTEPEKVAEYCFKYADAMIKEREK
jgi:hypothetical protein